MLTYMETTILSCLDADKLKDIPVRGLPPPGHNDELRRRRYAWAFNQDISGWAVDSVTDMKEMFYDASCAARTCRAWAVDSVTSMQQMFYYAADGNAAPVAAGAWTTRATATPASSAEAPCAWRHVVAASRQPSWPWRRRRRGLTASLAPSPCRC